MRLQIFDPARNQFVVVAADQVGMETLLLNILIEARIQSMMIQAMNPRIVDDDLSNLRKDAVSDPATFNIDPNL
jgi:hypothetical protein